MKQVDQLPCCHCCCRKLGEVGQWRVLFPFFRTLTFCWEVGCGDYCVRLWCQPEPCRSWSLLMWALKIDLSLSFPMALYRCSLELDSEFLFQSRLLSTSYLESFCQVRNKATQVWFCSQGLPCNLSGTCSVEEPQAIQVRDIWWE